MISSYMHKFNIVTLFKNKRFIATLMIFLTYLLYFFFSSSWHIPSTLVISGTAQSETEAILKWDSGEGFNEVESIRLYLGRFIKSEKKEHQITIKRLGKKNKDPLSRSSEVWIKEIEADGKIVNLKSFGSQNGVVLKNDEALYLQKAGTEFTFTEIFNDNLTITFLQNPWSGYVEIDIDRDVRTYDLFGPEFGPEGGEKKIYRTVKQFIPGSFKVTVQLPRYDIKKLLLSSVDSRNKFEINSIRIDSENGKVHLPLSEKKLISRIILSDVNRITRKYYHPVRFIFQVIFAALCTYLTFCLYNFVKKHGGIIKLFIGGRRFVFWLMFLCSILSFSAWLLAFWPGGISSDSIDIWRAAKIPGYFINYHPFLNMIYYLFLMQIWDNIAMVGICQIILSSLLGSYIFYYIFKMGVNIFLLLPFYILFALSIPIGIYNISLWKDIPFALLIVFWSFYVVKLYVENKQGVGNRTYQEIIVLAFLLIALCLIRHNGIVYMIIIPFALVFTKTVSLKRLAVPFFGVVLIITFVYTIVFPTISKTNFVSQQSKMYLEHLSEMNIPETAGRVVRRYFNIFDINMNFKESKASIWCGDKGWIKWHLNFIKRCKYNDFVKYIKFEPKSEYLYKLLSNINKTSYKKPLVYFSWNPFYMLYLYVILFFLYKYFPLTAIYSYVILSQVFILILVFDNVHWRYYYFLLFSVYFLVPIAALDIKVKRLGKTKCITKLSCIS